ncbi:MAG: aldo/keto reductase [Armatimonadetes bacterium]|nr:aldo/keto reductase [Armatimonadota bacterium]
MFQNHQPIALGCMGMSGVRHSQDITPAVQKRAIEAFEAALVAGITLFDHADIYGGGTCEEVFKGCLEAHPEARQSIQIWSKGGIRSGHFNLTGDYLREALDASLRRLGVEYVDLYQLHRPDPLAHPADTAKFLNEAMQSGKIKAVGVSNYFPQQTRALQKYLDAPIVSNQFEINALRLVPFYEGWTMPQYGGYSGGVGVVGDGLLDFCLAEKITPLAYAPLAGSVLSKSDSSDGRHKDVQDAVGELAKKYEATRGQIALAWLRTHPSGIIPVVGSNNPAHIFEAAQKSDLRLTHEEWYRVFAASWGRNMP